MECEIKFDGEAWQPVNGNTPIDIASLTDAQAAYGILRQQHIFVAFAMNKTSVKTGAPCQSLEHAEECLVKLKKEAIAHG